MTTNCYCIVFNAKLDLLVEEVDGRCYQGWIPIGSPFLAGASWHQAMYRRPTQ